MNGRLLLLLLGFASVLPEGGAKSIQLPPETARLRPSDLPGYGLASGLCVMCHSADYLSMQPPAEPRKYWEAEVAKMKKIYGAPIAPEQISPIAEYLTKAYGDGAK